MQISRQGTDYYPPEPLEQSGKVVFKAQFNIFESRFINFVTGQVTFGTNNANHFQLQNLFLSYVDIWGEEYQQAREFDQMVTDFYYPSQPSDRFYFDYNEASSGRNLIVTNPAGHKIFYSNLILGSNNLTFGKNIAIYPNPATNEFFVKFSSRNSEKLNVEIFDTAGKLIASQKIAATDAVNTETIPNGVYVVKVSGLEIRYSSKLIIRK